MPAATCKVSDETFLIACLVNMKGDKIDFEKVRKETGMSSGRAA